MESGTLPTLRTNADGTCGSLCQRVKDCSVSSDACASTAPWAARAETMMLETVEPCPAAEGVGTRSDADTRASTQARDAPTALPSLLRPGQVIARQMCKPLEEIIRGLDQQGEKKAAKKARHYRVAPESAVVNPGVWEATSQAPTTVAQETLNA